MLKCRTPKEWVEAAIAYGANPLYVANEDPERTMIASEFSVLSLTPDLTAQCTHRSSATFMSSSKDEKSISFTPGDAISGAG
jgi:hypothetical protein